MNYKGDIKFYYSTASLAPPPGPGAIAVDGANLHRDAGFETSVVISLFTDARADTSDVLPATVEDRGGYFGAVLLKMQIGSKLWLLQRSKIDHTTLRLFEQYAVDALKWMVADDIAETITAVAVAGPGNRILYNMVIKRKDNVDVTFKFFVNWEEQIAGGL